MYIHTLPQELFQAVDHATYAQRRPQLGDVTHAMGRWWRYCYASEALARGNILAQMAKVSHDDVICNTAAEDYMQDEYAINQVVSGESALSLTAGAYPGGMIHVNASTLAGDGNDGGCDFVLKNTVTKIYLRAVIGTLAAANNDDIEFHYPLSKVRKSPVSDATEPVIGVAPIAVTATYYFWAVTAGLCPVLVGEDASGAADLKLLPGDDTAGYAKIMAAGAEATLETYAPVFGTIVGGTDVVDKLCMAILHNIPIS